MHFTCQCILPTKCWVSMCCDLSFTVLCIYSCWIADTLYLKSCPNLVGNVRFIVASPLIPSLKTQTCIIRKQRMRAAQSEIDTAPCSNYDSTPVLLQTRLCRGRRRSGSRRWRSLCPSAGRCLIPPDPSSSTSCASRPRKMTSPTRRRPRPSRRSSGWVASWTWGGESERNDNAASSWHWPTFSHYGGVFASQPCWSRSNKLASYSSSNTVCDKEFLVVT